MRRWTTSYRFAWTPIVTFTKRQLFFLEWIEKNLDPVAFSDTPGKIGIALLSRDIRLTVGRSGMTLEDGAASDLGVTALGPALDGVLEMMEPKSIILRSASLAWSEAVPDVTYNEARASFARSLSGIAFDDLNLKPIDASGLMDVLSTTLKGQAEWGVVSAPELIERLSDPDEGRLANNRPEANLVGIDVEDLPEASIFVDTSLNTLNPDFLTTRTGIESAIESVEDSSKQLAAMVHSKALLQIGKTK